MVQASDAEWQGAVPRIVRLITCWRSNQAARAVTRWRSEHSIAQSVAGLLSRRHREPIDRQDCARDSMALSVDDVDETGVQLAFMWRDQISRLVRF